ncbi:MAG: molybdenum cofactor biosynthesis protein MoaE [Propionibacterium sp.]|nr:molybdenum cofactor biosynthesis protein MoaE [Propionibacterium sp.]
MPLELHARISSEPLSVDAALSRVRLAEVGGVGMFIGVVRNHDGGRSVTALQYSSHPTAEDALAECARSVAANHDVRAIAVEHRVGDLRIGDLAVVVAVGAAHRAAALECCRELIDRLKVEVPVWKRQSFTDGDVEWVGA